MSEEKYDNKKSAFAWRHVPEEGADPTPLIGYGSLIDGVGIGTDITLLAHKTVNGHNLLRLMGLTGQAFDENWKEIEAGKVWKQIGVLFVNDKDGNERAPDFTGGCSIPGMERISCWKGEKDGKRYLPSLSKRQP